MTHGIDSDLCSIPTDPASVNITLVKQSTAALKLRDRYVPSPA